MIGTAKTTIAFTLQLIALAIVHFLGFVIAAQLTGIANAPGPPTQAHQAGVHQAGVNQLAETIPADEPNAVRTTNVSDQQLRMARAVLRVCLLNSVAMLLWMRRSTLFGLAFVACVFALFFSCMTLMPQTEMWLFFGNSSNIIHQAGLMGVVVSGLFALASFVVLGRWREGDIATATSEREGCDAVFTLWRLLACAAIYTALYAIFGYFVAWRNPEVRALYGGHELLGFWEHTTSAPTATKVLPFQLLRGAVWGLLCLAMVRWSKGSTIGKALIVGLVLAVVMNAQLLLPNPIMSHNIRMIHLVETASSNFLFGVFAVLIWTLRIPRHRAEPG